MEHKGNTVGKMPVGDNNNPKGLRKKKKKKTVLKASESRFFEKRLYKLGTQISEEGLMIREYWFLRSLKEGPTEL